MLSTIPACASKTQPLKAARSPRTIWECQSSSVAISPVYLRFESSTSQRWAVKCFTRFVDHQEERYQRISEALRTVKKPWRVEFDYLSEGVMCEGHWYPALKMEWVDAVELIPFIEKHLWDPQSLLTWPRSSLRW